MSVFFLSKSPNFDVAKIKCFYSTGAQVLLANIECTDDQALHCLPRKTIFRDRNTSFYRKFDQPLKKIQNGTIAYFNESKCIG